MWLLWFESSPQSSHCILIAILIGSIERVPLTTGKTAMVVPQGAWSVELLCSKQLPGKDIICRITIQTHSLQNTNY